MDHVVDSASCCMAQVVGNLLLLDSEGKRIAVQYFSQEWCAFATSSTYTQDHAAHIVAIDDRTGLLLLIRLLYIYAAVVMYTAVSTGRYARAGPPSQRRPTLRSPYLPRPAEQTPGGKVRLQSRFECMRATHQQD